MCTIVTHTLPKSKFFKKPPQKALCSFLLCCNISPVVMPLRKLRIHQAGQWPSECFYSLWEWGCTHISLTQRYCSYLCLTPLPRRKWSHETLGLPIIGNIVVLVPKRSWIQKYHTKFWNRIRVYDLSSCPKVRISQRFQRRRCYECVSVCELMS